MPIHYYDMRHSAVMTNPEFTIHLIVHVLLVVDRFQRVMDSSYNGLDIHIHDSERK